MQRTYGKYSCIQKKKSKRLLEIEIKERENDTKAFSNATSDFLGRLTVFYFILFFKKVVLLREGKKTDVDLENLIKT